MADPLPQAAARPAIARRPGGSEPERLRDDALAAALAERLAHDRRTAHLGLELAVRGAVAHVTGSVGSPEERALVRRLVRECGGLQAAWDLLEVDGEPLRILDVGAGGRKQVSTAVALDVVPGPGVDVVADLEEALPFADDAFDHVFAVHVLEHVRELVGLMAELHRVLRCTGVLHVLAPHWRHPNAVADPTHVRFVDVETFKYFCTPHPRVLPWRPLMAASDGVTVHADLAPVKDGRRATAAELARWFA